jgi:uncharacterized membrane protein
MAKVNKQIRGRHVSSGQGASFEQQESYDDSLLPDAEELIKLQNIDSNIMPWIKERTAKEQDARHDFTDRRMTLLEKAQSRAYKVDLVSIILAFIIMMSGMYFSYLLIGKDKILESSLFAGATIFFSVRSFLNFNRNKSNVK